MNHCFCFTTCNFHKYRNFLAFTLFLILGIFNASYGITRHSSASGNWNSPSSWSPYGVPLSIDNVIILSNHIITVDNTADVNSIVIDEGGEVNFLAAKNLAIHNAITVYGKLTMNNGNIHFISGAFNLGPHSFFTWEPNDNTAAGASLFINGIEHFDPASTLIIKKWYGYSSVPLGSVVTGNFGNVTLNSLLNGLLYEWNQNNQFETHKIFGTLTIDQGWIVLDKSGSISNTKIGNINLTTPNAFLDFHKGTHISSFIVTTTNITNTGGNLNGIYNGNGNVALNVTGNFYNLGNVALIYNTGVFGVGNGNAIMNVAGDFNQSAGDFRAIFNLTTTNSGVSDLSFNAINLTGGIMMGQYSCHTSNAACNFNVHGKLNINFSKSTDKFRVVGLTSLSGTFNNAKSNLNVTGNLIISGNADAEFTSSGGVGSETVTIGGSAYINGGANNFNMGSHQLSLNTTGDVHINGGTTFLSKSPGLVTINIAGNYIQTAGVLSVKGHTGAADVTVSGDYFLTNGTTLLHSNVNTISADLVSLTIKGNFTHNGGTINYDDNAADNSINSIYIQGAQYTLNGNASVTRAGAGTASVSGNLYFSRAGTITCQRNSSSHSIQQVKQIIMNGCILDVVMGNLQVASHSQSSTDQLKITPGGILKMHASKIVSNNLASFSGLTVDNNGRLISEHVNGLYNGTDNACISSTGNMNFYLAPNSIIEYNGKSSQALTGIGTGIATTNNHKYGKLEINLQEASGGKNVYLNSPSVFVRTNLILTNGELNLNNNTLNIEPGAPTAITRQAGYIKSETVAAFNEGFIKWMNVSSGTYVFPFGVSISEYIPFSFTTVSGTGTVAIATRATGIDNMPYPAGGSLPAVTNLLRSGMDISLTSVFDRWYDVIANGFKANINLSYRGAENTTADSLSGAIFSIQSWDGSGWSRSMGAATGVRNGTGTIAATNVTSFGHWMISTRTDVTAATDILDFNAVLNSKQVDASWEVNATNNSGYFSIERSADRVSFSEIGKVNATMQTDEMAGYSFNDYTPIAGVSYYRVKRTDTNGSITYSETRAINFNDNNLKDFSIISISPNPFHDYIRITFSIPGASMTEINITAATGQLISSETINSGKGINSYLFSGKENLPYGVYVVTIRNGNNKFSKKIFKS
jgi:hypothetical protein